MSRSRLPRAPSHSGPAVDPDWPEPGCYRVRLRADAPDSVIRIWLGLSIDPATGQEMLDRSPMMQCELNGERNRIDPMRFWPGCARERISREEYDRIAERNATMDPESPFYDPAKPIDLGRAPPPF